MNPEVRAKLVKVIASMYTLAQLNTFVRKALDQGLEYYAVAPDLLTTVDKLIEELERTPDDLETFLAKLRVWEMRPALRAAIDAYYGAPGAEDPYDALLILSEPFVNRQISRNKLRDLFQGPNRRALVVRGPRASGKSHSRWLIEQVARSEEIEPVFVELKDNVLEDIIWQIINDLSLPPQEFRDRLAQASTMTKGFISALRGSARKMQAGERWCLIFDSHDYDTVAEANRNFVNELLFEVANLQMQPIWIVVLGHREVPPGSGPTAPPARLITDEILHVTQPDIEKFLLQLSEQQGQSLAQGRSAALTADIFQGLQPPLDHLGMQTLAHRLREKILEIGIV
jgi:hypothetical protein